jgi:hypothetical protein
MPLDRLNPRSSHERENERLRFSESSSGIIADLRTVEHSGGDRGIAANLVRYPDQKLSIALLCNSDAINSMKISEVGCTIGATSLPSTVSLDRLFIPG